MQRPIFTIVVLCLLALVPSRAHAQDRTTGYRIELNQLEVLNAREKQGDRPYLVMIPFRAQILQRGTSSVSMVEAEPHDWVAKQPYRRALKGRDHAKVGDRIPIPWWMGQHEFRQVPIIASAKKGKPWVFGVIVVALDNNNTPPHVVRNLISQIRTKLRGELVAQLERGDLVRGVNLLDTAAIQRRLKDRLPQLANRLIQGLGFNVFDWTFGSTFNPDKLAGVQVFLWPALGNASSGRYQQTRRIAGDRLVVKANWGPAPFKVQPLSFIVEGSNARYRVSGVLREIQSNPEPVTHAHILLKTGDDDLQHGGQIHITLQGAGGRRAVFNNINRGRGFRRYGESTFVQRLPAGWRAGDLERVEIATTRKAGDTWRMQALGVRFHGARFKGPVLAETGKPVLFRGTTRHRSFDHRRR